MAHRIVGINRVNEVTLTRKGMNPHAKVVLLKSRDAPRPAPTPEPTESDMDMKLLVKAASLEGPQKAYFSTLTEDDKIKAFLEGDDTVRAPLVKSWEEGEAEKVRLAEVEKAKREGKAPEVIELEKSVGVLQKELNTLKSERAERDLADKAKSAYPNVPNALAVLKSVASLSAEAQKPTLDLLKAQNDAAALITKSYGGPANDVEGSASNKLKSVVKSYAETNKVSENEALLAVTELPEHQELIEQVREEEAA